MSTASASPRSVRRTAPLARAALLIAFFAGMGRAAAADDAPRFARELVLAGGALELCASLARDACAPGHAFAADARGPARYRIDAAGIDAATAPALWRDREPMRLALRALLADLDATRTRATDAQGSTDLPRRDPEPHALDEDALSARLERACVDSSADGEPLRVRACRDGERGPWSRIDDDARAAVFAALERPQIEAGVRRRERAALAQGAQTHGAEILRAFVAAARARAGGATPKVAVVTAAAFDPFDPVDVYLDALRQAGAEPEWWPVDAALAAAVFERRDCDALPALRLERLGLPGRERVYPDLVAQQRRACIEATELAAVPERVHGVFFGGGDQWKLRRAFFDRDDRANAWLLALRARAARGEIAIGGTSAGSAVQSGAPMLSNGTVERALLGGAIAAPPPTSGCARSGDCAGGLDEDAFTYWPAGGLALAPELIVDTHFSERARELRLLRLLTDTGRRWGIGADETSALHLRWVGRRAIELRALGASGGWVFDAASACRAGDLRVLAYYLAPGATLRIDRRGARFVALPTSRRPTPDPALPRDALDAGALRGATQRIAATDGGASHVAALYQKVRALERMLKFSRTDATVVAHASDAAMASVGPLRIEVARWPGCGR